MSDVVNIIVNFNVKVGRSKELQAFFKKEFISRSVKEKGCLLYELWQSNESENSFTVVEKWADKHCFDTHIAQEWFVKAIPILDAMLTEPPEFNALTQIL